MSESLDNEIIKNMTQSVEHLRAAEATHRLYQQAAETILAEGRKDLIQAIRTQFPEVEKEYKIDIGENKFVACDSDNDYISVYKEKYPYLAVSLGFVDQKLTIGVNFIESTFVETHTVKIQELLKNKLGTGKFANVSWPWFRYFNAPFDNWCYKNTELVELFFINDYKELLDEFQRMLGALDELYIETDILLNFKENA